MTFFTRDDIYIYFRGNEMEEIVIYADVLFFINFVIDGLCLAVTALMTGRRFVLWRFLCGCAIGGLYSIAALKIGEIMPLLAVVPHLGAAVLMCLTAFPFKGAKRLAGDAACFFAACAILGGAMYAIYGMCGKFVLYNGAFYAELSPAALIASALFAATVLVFCIGKAKSRASAKHCELVITYKGKSCSLFCLADSGNLMHCPYTALPVAAIKPSALLPLFDRAALSNLKETPAGEGIRPIPACGIGGKVIMPSFIPESAKIRAFGTKEYKEASLCIAIDFGSCSYGGCDGAVPTALIRKEK